jgi:O-antigen ligase
MASWKQKTPVILLAISIALIASVMLVNKNGFQVDALNIITDRFAGGSEMSENAGERADTMMTAIGLIVEHPFGMGAAYTYEMEAKVGLEATHNAFLQLTLLGGLPLSLAITLLLVASAKGVLHRDARLESWLAAYLCMVFFFETAFFISSIPALTLWLAWPARQSRVPLRYTAIDDSPEMT